MINLSVNIKSTEKSYPIIIDNNDISGLKAEIQKYLQTDKFLVVISEKVYKLYGKSFGFSNDEIFILKDGEKEKNFKNYQKIIERALKMGLTRKDALIAVGGGVCGDITGFAASTYMRGINFIQVPTTLLACVDSSVGGKTGIDTDFGKNLVGSFYQPNVVLINTNFLKTLSEREFKTGLGEIVKYSFIEKSCLAKEEFNLTNFLNSNTEQILERNLKILEELIKICISLKIAVVEQDEKEGGLRKILNFGHTYGHAVEKITKYKKYTHGEAIVKGMQFAFNLAYQKDIIDSNYKYLAEDIIKKFNFREVEDFDISKMIQIMKMDKKASSSNIIFILPVDYSTVKEFEFCHNDLSND